MGLFIADNLNVHNFSLKLVIFCKKAILEQNWPFKANLLYLNEDNVNQNMLKQKILITLVNYIFYFLIICQ